MLGTDHHIVSLLAILDARDDMNRLAGRFGGGTRAGSRRSRLGGTPARPGLLSRGAGLTGGGACCWSRRVRSATCCCNAAIWVCKALSRSGRARSAAGSGEPRSLGGRRLLGEGSQAALMQAGQQVQVLLLTPFLRPSWGWLCRGS